MSKEIPEIKNERLATPTPATTLEKLRKLSINDELDEMRKQARAATYIAGRMALAGQLTVLYAGPNTGKTLLSLRLVSEAIANGTAGEHVYHINLDDSYEGLISKAELGVRHGFGVISPTKFSHPNKNFAELVGALIKDGVANQTVFIMDTVKKFVDVMDKKASSEFTTTCRRLTSAGGSIIALAHVNKNRGEENKGIPAGTSDILDDCDCAYVIDLLKEERVTDGSKRTVEFQNKKARGPVVKNAVYSYINFDDSDYNRIFESVSLVDGNEADLLRAEKAVEFEQNKDADLIKEISKMLQSSGETLQQDILTQVCSSDSYPRRSVLACLHRWSRPENEDGLWLASKGQKNSRLYKMEC